MVRTLAHDPLGEGNCLLAIRAARISHLNRERRERRRLEVLWIPHGEMTHRVRERFRADVECRLGVERLNGGTVGALAISLGFG
jgi:hypothetical protein